MTKPLTETLFKHLVNKIYITKGCIRLRELLEILPPPPHHHMYYAVQINQRTLNYHKHNKTKIVKEKKTQKTVTCKDEGLSSVQFLLCHMCTFLAHFLAILGRMGIFFILE